MELESARDRIATLRQELLAIPSYGSPEFTSWKLRTKSVLIRILGEQHHITQAFEKVSWLPSVYSDAFDMQQEKASAFHSGSQEAIGLLDAAGSEIDLLAEDRPIADASGIDSELWDHISAEIQSESWGKVASQAVIFTEDRLRKWSGRPVGEVGKDLAVAIFGAQGSFQMGLTPGEIQGWQLIAQGVAQAVRNVDAHRIQQRVDHKRYALGVVGTCSLLLTQMRYEHSNRFRDTTPASSDPQAP